MVLIFTKCLKWSSFLQFVFNLVIFCDAVQISNGTLYKWHYLFKMVLIFVVFVAGGPHFYQMFKMVLIFAIRV